MNGHSLAIMVLCSHLCVGEGVKPLEPAEFTRFEERLTEKGALPHEVLSLSFKDFMRVFDLPPDDAARIAQLVKRCGSIVDEIEKYSSMGIFMLTKADTWYPGALKRKLGKSCPPIFYCAGNPELTNIRCAGFVGSRNVGADDEAFTVATVGKVNDKGYSVVSGGARGIDSIASCASIANGSCCVEFVPDSLTSRIKRKAAVCAIAERRLLILSAAIPDSRFFVGFAMMRNRYIYAQSEGTVIIKSDYNKGGTWNGAAYNLRQRLCNTFCWNNLDYEGNVELIKRGAIPIDESWGGDLSGCDSGKAGAPEQLSFF